MQPFTVIVAERLTWPLSLTRKGAEALREKPRASVVPGAAKTDFMIRAAT